MQQAERAKANILGGPVIVVVIAASFVISAAMGARQTFGLFLGPLALEGGFPVGIVALAIALHNLVWGLAQPLAGAAADRYGAAPLVALGAFAYAAGLSIAATTTSTVLLMVGLSIAATTTSTVLLMVGLGLLVGIGMSCTTFGVVLTAVGRSASAERRSLAMGLASAGGSLGQILLAPVAQFTIGSWGPQSSLLGLAVLLAIAAPFGVLLAGQASAGTSAHTSPMASLSEMLTHALHHRGYRLLTLGFFTCGFQLAFISTYLPGYLNLCHMPAGLGATALALIGFFNMIGSWACGWLGGRFRQQHVLGWLYLIRGLAIAIFFLTPKSDTSVVVFAAVMGLTWLGTVPLTSGWVAKVFGIGHLGTLFGVCFFSHQVGSFLGAWLGGFVFDLTGSYGPVWILTAASGALAALLHFPIRDTSRADLPLAARA